MEETLRSAAKYSRNVPAIPDRCYGNLPGARYSVDQRSGQRLVFERGREQRDVRVARERLRPAQRDHERSLGLLVGRRHPSIPRAGSPRAKMTPSYVTDPTPLDPILIDGSSAEREPVPAAEPGPHVSGPATTLKSRRSTSAASSRTACRALGTDDDRAEMPPAELIAEL